MIKTTIYLSAYQKNDNVINNIARHIKRLKIVKQNLLNNGLEYSTILKTDGVYKMESEKSLQIILYIENEQVPAVKTFAGAIKKAFNQDSIMLDINGDINFI